LLITFESKCEGMIFRFKGIRKEGSTSCWHYSGYVYCITSNRYMHCERCSSFQLDQLWSIISICFTTSLCCSSCSFH